MKIIRTIYLLFISALLTSCAGFNSYFKNNDVFININEDYTGKVIYDKTLLIKSIENECIDLRCTEGLNDDVRRGKSKDLFIKWIKKELPKRIRQNSTFKSVKYQTAQDSNAYDFTLALKNIVALSEIPTGDYSFNSSPFGGGATYIASGDSKVKVLLFCTFEIIDNLAYKTVLVGNVGSFGELDCDELKKRKKKKKKRKIEDYFDENRIVLSMWKKAISTLSFKLMDDTPFFKKVAKKKKS